MIRGRRGGSFVARKVQGRVTGVIWGEKVGGVKEGREVSPLVHSVLGLVKGVIW